MSRFALTNRITRLAFGAALLLFPIVTVWNLLAAPGREIRIGPKLGGVTSEAALALSWSSLRDGSYQKAVASRVTDAFAFRPLLIRIHRGRLRRVHGSVGARHLRGDGLAGHPDERPPHVGRHSRPGHRRGDPPRRRPRPSGPR